MMRLLVSGCTATFGRIAPACPDVLGRLMTTGISPESCIESGLPWGMDNGAFTGFRPAWFRSMLARVKGQPRCLFVACPDVVADARGTLALFDEWEAEVRASGQPVAFVSQDGQDGQDVPWGRFDALFVGGSTAWKLSPQSAALCAEAKTRGLHVHMGRVNSLRRMKVARDFGCDSVDGTGMSRWGDRHLARFCGWARAVRDQKILFRGDVM